MSDPVKIMICIPQTSQSYYRDFVESYIAAKNYLFYRANELPFNFLIVEYFCHTFPIDANRNECAWQAMESNVDLTIWMDTDQIFPVDFLYKMIKHDLPIVAGIYHAKAPPYHPIIFKESKRSVDFNLFDSVVEFPEEDLFEADMIGMGAVAIRTEVFKQLAEMGIKEFFAYGQHPRTSQNPDAEFKWRNGIRDASEDVHFYKLVRKYTDFKVLIDPTIDIVHLGAPMQADRSVFNVFKGQTKQNLVEREGIDALKEKELRVCRAEPIKSDSLKKMWKSTQLEPFASTKKTTEAQTTE